MPDSHKQRALLLRYLFGEVSENEKGRIEGEYFANDHLFEELLALEDELIEEYLKGKLSPHERQRFEKGYLASPVKRQQVVFAKQLSAYTETSDAAPLQADRRPHMRSVVRQIFATPNGLRWALAIGCVLIALAAGIAVAQYVKIKQQLNEAQQEVLRLRQDNQALQQLANKNAGSAPVPQTEKDLPQPPNDNLPEKPDESGKDEATPTIATLTLRPRLARGVGENASLVMRSKVRSIRLRLELESPEYKTYQAVAQTAEGLEVWRQPTVKVRRMAEGNLLILSLPAKLFALGDYLISVSGIKTDGGSEPVSEYHFRISRP